MSVMNERKEKFLTAVRILAAGDEFILRAAEWVGEEHLSMAPGCEALEFVVAMQQAKKARWPCRNRFKRRSWTIPALHTAKPELSFEEALQVKSAELWLKLGHPEEALREIRTLPESLQKHAAVLKAHLDAVRAAREAGEEGQRR